jgi:hypothetical protein
LNARYAIICPENKEKWERRERRLEVKCYEGGVKKV